uniref:Putative secreted peptide n=1 Tax=Anopheles braziliensis TaxID=58242 RepID=A0A2M3ZVL6_9DIPT
MLKICVLSYSITTAFTIVPVSAVASRVCCSLSLSTTKELRANFGPATPGMKNSLGVSYSDEIDSGRHCSKMSDANGNGDTSQQGVRSISPIESLQRRAIKLIKFSIKQFGSSNP